MARKNHNPRVPDLTGDLITATLAGEIIYARRARRAARRRQHAAWI